jgi:hypothetical protein
MKKNKLTLAVVAGLAGVAGMANAAKHINPEGTGEVLVYPYYSVNNGLNTLYSVVNTTAKTKAVKVRFLEGENTIEVLDFNVYLSAYDVWTGALLPTVSTQNGHAGEASGMHLSFDTSCAPRLNKSGQEFLPFAIDNQDFLSVLAGNNVMDRATDGHFEIIEMATWSDGTATYAAADHGTVGVPASCGTIEAFWPANGGWQGDPEELTEGGLFGSANIVNVASGVSMTYDAIAIDDFWTNGVGEHTDPGRLFPSIGSGDISATIFNEGVATTSVYPSSVQATSALFMRDEIYNEYSLDTAAAGKTEWVVTFPTKNLHVNGVAVAPFWNTWDGTESCHEFGMLIWDREEQEEAPAGGLISPEPPPGENAALCYEVNVIEFHLPGTGSGPTSQIMGSDNLLSVTTPSVDHATENGWARIQFIEDNSRPYVDAAGYNGLPVAGFAATQFTNAGAGEGLLAQYAGLFMHKGRVTSTTIN